MTRVPLRERLPSTALFRDYLENWSRVEPFYPRNYSLDAIARFARERPPLDAGHRSRLCAVLSEQQSAFAGGQEGVEKLAAGAVAVVTGQQPVLFTGPLFSILKAISAIKIARQLERSGIPAVPVFWVAAEDHDYQEIESTWILDRHSGVCQIAVDLRRDQPMPAGWIEYLDDVNQAVDQCLEKLPQSEFVPELAAVLKDAYRPGVSPVMAFARMMARLFSGSDLTFVDPLHEGLRGIAQPTIDLAVRRNAAMREALLLRNRELSEAGYHQQVKVDQNFTGLFAYRGKARQALRPDELGNGIAWSPNVLLRPVFQDTLFPTAVYIAGPAEVAYFAQAAAVYQVLDRPMPPVFPRISATVIEPRVRRVLEKYGMGLEDVFRGKEHLKKKAVGSARDDDPFETVRDRIDGQLESLRPVLVALDPTLVGALETSREKVLYQLEALRGKYVSAAVRRDETLERQIDTLCNSLFPGGKLQERTLGITSFIARYGLGIVSSLADILSLETTEHQVVEV